MILVVEPDEDLQELIESSLKRDGLRVITIDDPQDAIILISRLQRGGINIVICAVPLPRMTFRSFLERVRNLAGDVKFIVTADLVNDGRNSVASLPVDAVLYKPFSLDELSTCVAKLLPSGPG